MTAARTLWASLEPADRNDALHALWALPLAALFVVMFGAMTP